MKEEARRGAGWQKNQQLGNGPEWRGHVAMPKIRAQVRIEYLQHEVGIGHTSASSSAHR